MYPNQYLSQQGEKVEALQVTEESLEAVAAWTDGEVVRLTQTLVSGDFTWVGVRFHSKDGVNYARLSEWIVHYDRPNYQFRSYPDRVFKNFFTNY